MSDWWESAPVATKANATSPAPTANWWEGASVANPAKKDQQGRASRADREAENTTAQTKAAYTEMASGVRERQSPLGRYADTVVRGLARAVPVMDDIAALGDTVTGGGQGGTFGERYSDNLMRQRAMNQADDTERPVASYGSQVVGGVAALPTFGVAANTVKGGAALGAGYGAAYGFGAGDGLADRAQKAGGGAIIGGVLGGAIPAAVNGVTSGISAIRGGAAPLVGAVNPEAEAARRIGTALERDAKSASNGLSQAEYSAAQSAGLPVVAADMGGETTRALARSAANSSPEARAAINSTVANRFEGQGDRVTTFISELSPLGSNATKTLDQLQSAARQANKPAYARAYAEGANGVWDDALAQLAQAPAVQSAIKDATRTGANRAVADGFPPVKNPFTIAENGTVSLTRNADGSIATPSLQFWDHVKRNLDDMIESARRSGNMNQARDVGDLKNSLLSRLDSMAPSYASARQGAAAAFGAQDALEAGQKFVTAAGKNEQFASAIAKMNPAERNLFHEGFASEMRAKLAEVSDKRAVINHAFFTSQASRQRIEMALGKDAAAKLETQLHVERIMDSLRGAMGNSTTARQLMELGMAGGQVGMGAAAGYGLGGDAKSASIGTIAAALLRAGRGKIDQRVSQKVAEMLMSDNPEVIKRAINMVSKSDALLTAVRGFDETAIKAITQNTPTDAAGKFVSGMNPSRADNEQPNQRNR